MSILTGAELGGGLPPPGTPTLIQRPDRGKESSSEAVSFSSDAAILQLTNSATREVVQRGQELIDRRNEQNAAEKDEAREAAAAEVRNRSLEEQGLREPEADEDQAAANTLQGQAVSSPQGEAINTVQGEAVNTVQADAANTVQSETVSTVPATVVAEGIAPEATTEPLDAPAIGTGETVADGEQKTETIDDSGHLDVVA